MALTDDQRKAEAKAAGLLKREQELEKRRQAAAQKLEDKAAEQALRAVQAQQRLRHEAAATTQGVDVLWDVEFAKAAGQDGIFLDLWRPMREQPAEEVRALPVVLWLHGGGWKFGTHHIMPRFLRRLTDSGYAIVSVGYRKSGIAPFPACVQDCKAAVRWVRANSSAHGLDAQQIGVLGSSAGAHLAAMLGTTIGVPELEGQELGWAAESSAVSAVVGIAGPMDLARTCSDHGSAKTLEALLLGAPVGSVPAAVQLASPVMHVGVGTPCPPFLLVHGDQDEEVSIEQSEMLLSALLAAGSEASLIRVLGGRHPKFGEQVGPGSGVEAQPCLASAWDGWSEALEHSVPAFFDRHLARNG